MLGLTVRWSLVEAREGVEQELVDYVSGTSHARFMGMEGLRFKTWRMVPGQWFEGCYVFESSEARAAFEAGFREGAAQAPVSQLVGAAPELVEPCQIVAVAEGAAGFAATADAAPGAEAGA